MSAKDEAILQDDVAVKMRRLLCEAKTPKAFKEASEDRPRSSFWSVRREIDYAMPDAILALSPQPELGAGFRLRVRLPQRSTPRINLTKEGIASVVNSSRRFTPLGGAFPCRNGGWFRPHITFPHHKSRLAPASGFPRARIARRSPQRSKAGVRLRCMHSPC